MENLSFELDRLEFTPVGIVASVTVMDAQRDGVAFNLRMTVTTDPPSAGLGDADASAAARTALALARRVVDQKAAAQYLQELRAQDGRRRVQQQMSGMGLGG